MKDLALQLLKSKRTWISVVTLAVHALHHYCPQCQIGDSQIDSIADQALIAVGAVAVIATKVRDGKKDSDKESK